MRQKQFEIQKKQQREDRIMQEKDEIMREKELEVKEEQLKILRLQKELHIANDKVEREQREAALFNKCATLFFKLKNNGWNNIKIKYKHPFLAKF